MAKIINSKALNHITSADEGFIDSKKFKKIKSNKAGNGAITLIRSCSGYRVRLSTMIYESLDKPETVDISIENGTMIIGAVPDGMGEFDVKSGRIIYSNNLAKQIINVNPNIDFEIMGSTSCGVVVHSQTTDEGFNEIVISF